VTVDASGDVIAGGDALGVLNTVKLSGATGAELWRTNAGGTGAQVYDAVVEADGNVVVAGGYGTAFFVAKLAGTSGLPVWIQTVGNSSAFATSVAVTGGSIAVTGIVGSPAHRSFAVVDFAGGVTGKRLFVRDKAGDASARRLAALSKDPRILAGAAGTPPDPTVSGATLTLANPTTGETVALPLPASNWSASRLSIPGLQRYNYSDPALAAGPCNSVVLSGGKQIKVRCKGSQLGFSLDEPAQGSLDLRLTIGSVFEYCMRFGGTVRHDVPATSSQAGIFDAVDAPATACPNGGP